MKVKLGKIVLFLAGLFVLQQGIAFGSSRFGQLNAQVQLIENHDIDPSAMFYMESDLALKAQRQVRLQLSEDKTK